MVRRVSVQKQNGTEKGVSKTTRTILFFCATFLVNVSFSPNAPGKDLPFYGLKVTLDPTSHKIVGEGKITVPHGIEGFISEGNLKISKLNASDRLAKEKDPAGGSMIRVGAGEIFQFRYEALFPPEDEREVIENVGVTGSNIIDEKGIMLISGWYPSFSLPCLFGLEVTLPAEFEAVSESNRITVTHDRGKGIKTQKFYFPVPLSGITLVGGKYILREERYRGVSIRTYFFPADDHLFRVYTESMKKYIDLYGEMLGEYPFESFSIVENIFQTGYSFPTYTLLGSRIVPLKYVPDISLGHEFLHQWFGHLVEVDRTQGNWSEGLTTYLADHWYKELAGEGHRYRKKILIDYMNYVTPSRDIPVSRFQGRLDFATRAIGYGKTAMIFHMARKMLGEDAFFSALKKFIEENAQSEAGWDELRDSFMASGGLDLGQLIDIWTKKKGMADLEITPPVVKPDGNMFILSMDVFQRNGPYFFRLPVKVETEDFREDFLINVEGGKTHFVKALRSIPLKVYVDEDYDTFRRLSRAEIPPVISGFTGNKDNVVIVPEAKREGLSEVAQFFKNQGYRVVGEKHITEEILARSSFLLISSDIRTLPGLPGFFNDIEFPRGGFAVKVLRNPLNREKVAVLFDYDDPGQLKRAYRKIFRYGNYSLIVFEKGRNILKETEPAERGVVFEVRRVQEKAGERP
jgi:hypothetical protein